MREFCDWCCELRHGETTPDQARALLRRLQELGYAHIAWNETVIGREGVRQLQKTKKDTDATLLAAQRPGAIEQLRRVTMVTEDVGAAQFFVGSIRALNLYDLIAARPTTDKALAFLCESADVNIISIDLSARLPFMITPRLANKATSRGVMFEIMYAAAVRETAGARRQQVLLNAMNLAGAVRGKTVVLSSGADHPDFLRGPHDVANLGVTLGLKEEQALAAVSSTCRVALSHAKARRLEYLPIEITNRQAPSRQQGTAAADSAPPSSMDVDSHDEGEDVL